MSPQPSLARFGTFEFDLDTLELRRQGVRVAIEPQPARALALLLQSPGEIVSREALKQALWKDDVHVDFDRGLAYVIGQVRSALGDSADNPRFLETLPKRGFRFIAPVDRPSPGPSGPVPPQTHGAAEATPYVRPHGAAEATPYVRPHGAAEATPYVRPHGGAEATPYVQRRTRGRVLAVLAFVAVVIAIVTFALAGKRPVLAVAIFDNETGQPQYDQFTNGMADAVIDRLGKLDLTRLGVIGNARTLRMPRSERDLTQIRTETGATFILISVLQRQEGGIRLLTQLIRLDDGRHVWVKRFERADGDMVGLEAEILAAVESGVRVHIMAEPGPSPAPASR